MSYPKEELLIEHCKMAAQIHALVNLRSYLIDQMHHKKAKLKRNKYHCFNKTTSKFYCRIFFENRNGTCDTAFPIYNRGKCDDVLFTEFNFRKDFDFYELKYEYPFPDINLYYFGQDIPDNISLKGNYKKAYIKSYNFYFNKKDWNLDECPHLTEKDIITLKILVKTIITTFEKTFAFMKRAKINVGKQDLNYLSFYEKTLEDLNIL